MKKLSKTIYWTKNQHNLFIKQYKTDMDSISSKLNQNDKSHEMISFSLQQIHQKLDALNKIRLNGSDSELSFEQALRELYSVTKSERHRKKMFLAFNNWMNVNPVGKIFKSKIGKLFLLISVIWILTSSFYTLGIPQLEPANIVKTIYNFAKDLF